MQANEDEAECSRTAIERYRAIALDCHWASAAEPEIRFAERIRSLLLEMRLTLDRAFCLISCCQLTANRWRLISLFHSKKMSKQGQRSKFSVQVVSAILDAHEARLRAKFRDP